jgi:hypothetical protein
MQKSSQALVPSKKRLQSSLSLVQLVAISRRRLLRGTLRKSKPSSSQLGHRHQCHRGHQRLL